jgi:glycerol-3-phosphate dehydrogenase (NAD(P)+)
MSNVTVLGCGAWGTTLAKILVENGYAVTIWCHDQHLADTINQTHKNPLLKGIALPAELTAVTSLAQSLTKASLVVAATASKFFEETLLKAKQFIPAKAYILSATKGLSEKTDQRMYQIMEEILPEHREHLAVLSGPNIAMEIARQKIAATVIASLQLKTAQHIQKMFNNQYFRVYTNTDVIGTEIGGTLKNIIAIAAGIIDGLDLGSNAKASLMIRGMVEMSRLSHALGARPETLSGLTGMGDLITTCSSSLSRNHYVGVELAKGKKIQEILTGMTAVAEGVATTKAAHDLAKIKNVSMPITEQMYAVLYHNKPISEAVRTLMARDLKSE